MNQRHWLVLPFQKEKLEKQLKIYTYGLHKNCALSYYARMSNDCKKSKSHAHPARGRMNVSCIYKEIVAWQRDQALEGCCGSMRWHEPAGSWARPSAHSQEREFIWHGFLRVTSFSKVSFPRYYFPPIINDQSMGWHGQALLLRQLQKPPD